MRRIPLTQDEYALVSERDYKYLLKWKWTFDRRKKSGYAIRRSPSPEREKIYMHTAVANRMKLKGEIDHRHRDKLDNRRSILRAATRSQNSSNHDKQSNNTSGYKGVSWYERYSKWSSYIRLKGKRIFLGYFPGTAKGRKAAARRYDVEAVKLFKNFAVLNFPKAGTT